MRRQLLLGVAGMSLLAPPAAPAAPLTPVITAPVAMAEASDGTVFSDVVDDATFLDAAVNQPSTQLFATDVASGRTIRLSTPQLARPVDFSLQMTASDSRSIFVTAHARIGLFAFSTPVTQTTRAQLLTSQPLPTGHSAQAVVRSRDGSRVLSSYFGPDEQDPRQDLMVGRDPEALYEPWTLPSE